MGPENSLPLILMMVALFVVIMLVAGFALALLKTRQWAKQFPPGGDFISVDGVKLHYRRNAISAKRSPATVTLVLHGAASNLEEPHAALSGSFADCDVIWLDRPGLGWSERPSKGRWSPQREARLIAQFLDALEIKTATIIGHSWGGAIAMRLAIDHSHRVEGLVLIAPPLCAWIGGSAWFNAASFWPLIGAFITRIFVPLTGESALAKGAISAFHPEKVPAHYLTSSALPLLLRPTVWLANAADMRDVNHHLEQQEKFYVDIKQPTIIIAGKADTVVWTHRHSGMVSRRMQNAELRLIPGAGHNPHHDHPKTILEAVQDVRRHADISARQQSLKKLPKLVKMAE